MDLVKGKKRFFFGYHYRYNDTMKPFPLSLEETEKLYQAGLLKADGAYSEALIIIQDLFSRHPDFAPLHNHLGSIYFAMHDFQKASLFFESAIKIMPDYFDAYYNLGLALTREKKMDSAIQAYQHLIELSPEHGAARFQLACLFMRNQAYKEAIAHFLINANYFPNHLETQINLATAYLKLGELLQAKLHYLNALELSQNDEQVLFNLGILHMQTGDMEKAIFFYTEAVKLSPDSFEAHNNLGYAFLSMQDKISAVLHYREALRIDPTNEAIRHTIHILTQEKNLHTSPPEYIRSLFDSYAGHFESHLVQSLDYQVPALMQALIQKSDFFSRKKNILDLGCGTGLCGERFKPNACNLTGVDLSSKMLALARQKNVYDELIQSDIISFLSEKNNEYDLILAADVVVYSGDLSQFFSLVSQALKSRGLFVFNTEISDAESYQMTSSGRFSHHKAYLEALALRYSFQVEAYDLVRLRTQNQSPVPGHLYAFKKNKN